MKVFLNGKRKNNSACGILTSMKSLSFLILQASQKKRYICILSMYIKINSWVHTMVLRHLPAEKSYCETRASPHILYETEPSEQLQVDWL